MADLQASSTIASLRPPRKSIELEDPGAHYLDASETEEEVFSDAREGHGSSSGANSPIPTTRVEKVDDKKSYGEVPGTVAYDMRSQDAVPDELEIIPDGEKSRPYSRANDKDRNTARGGSPIPKTVVQKLDPTSPSHGEVPGTTAYSVRAADAAPDMITKIRDPEEELAAQKISLKPNETPIPKIVQPKKESEWSHGEVLALNPYESSKENPTANAVKQGDISGLPTSSLNRSNSPMTTTGASPIAADGGFGPMKSEAESDQSEADADADADADAIADDEFEEGAGDDFDDFEAGAIDDDFGDFDEDFQQPPSPTNPDPEQASSDAAHVSYTSPFPLLDFSALDSLDDLITASESHLDELFPTTQNPILPSSSMPQNYSIFLTDRSLSLWSQLVAPPPLQPPNWVRSRIRRLFLVSLGVPVDLDEILPASKQKKLILPSTGSRGDSHSSCEGRRNGSRVRVKQDNTSSASIDQQSTLKSNRRRKGPPPPPELDLGTTKMIGMTTDAALSNFDDEELQAHIRKLEELTARASEVLEYWLTRKDNALGDKEAFEGVIENLVKHARRVRK